MLTLAILGSVLVVNPSGGPFPTIDAAVAAAQPGDTVLVKTGTYGALQLGSKPLVVSADVGAVVQINETVTVQDLAAGDSIVLRGLRVKSAFGGAGLRVLNSPGELWVEDCVLEGTSLPRFVVGRGAVLEDAESVSFTRCDIRGGSGGDFLITGGDGLVLMGTSGAHLFDCTARGGVGPPLLAAGPATVGGAGARVAGGFLYASGSTFLGGVGGPGFVGLFGAPCSDGGQGGPGLLVEGTTAEVHLHDHAATGGAGGASGGASCVVGPDGGDVQAPPGVVATIPGVARRVDAVHPVREGELLTFNYQGLDGDLALHFLAAGQDAVFTPALGGTVLLEPVAFQLLWSGLLPAGGSAQHALTVGPIAASSALVYTQLVVLNAASPLSLQVGNGQSVLVLDSAF